MNEEIIVTGKTVEEAMATAAAKYSGDNVSYEIAEMPKKGFFGLGAVPAKIKVIIYKEEPADLKKETSPVKETKATTNKSISADKPENKRTPPKKAERKPDKKSETKSAYDVASKKEPRIIVVTDEEKQYALEFANTLLKNMNVDAAASYDGIETAGEGRTSYPKLVISGEGAGILIGHHGETLDAIQYLVNLSALRRSGSTQKEFVKIVVDIEGYREKREETLRALARRMAAKAQKYKRNVVLEPMNPYERRIIHSEIQGFENVSTHSVGSDENRKIIITYEGADKIERRPRRSGRRSDYYADNVKEAEAVDAENAEEEVEVTAEAQPETEE